MDDVDDQRRRIDVEVSPVTWEAIKAEAKERAVTVQQVAQERIDKAVANLREA